MRSKLLLRLCYLKSLTLMVSLLCGSATLASVHDISFEEFSGLSTSDDANVDASSSPSCRTSRCGECENGYRTCTITECDGTSWITTQACGGCRVSQCGPCQGAYRTCTIRECDGSVRTITQRCPTACPYSVCSDCVGGYRQCRILECNGAERIITQRCQNPGLGTSVIK